MTGKIMVVAGEISGDQRAAEVVEQIKYFNPHINFFGMGSDKLREQGVEVVIDPTDINSIGFVEAIKNYKIHNQNYRVLKDMAEKRDPDVFFLVDYSGFNMKMARLGAKMDIPVVDYFPPSAWLWGEWRAKIMSRYNALIAANFPMERDIYRKNGAHTEFVGHPLVDEVEVNKDKEELEEVKEELEESEQNLLKTKRAIKALKEIKEKQGKLPTDKEVMYQRLLKTKKVINKSIEKKESKKAELEEILNNVERGKIKVYEKVFSGVKMIIGKSQFNVHEELHHSSFIEENGEIRQIPL